MKRLFIYPILLIVTACNFKNSGKTGPEATFYIEISGMQTSLHMIFDLNNTNELCEKSSETIRLKVPSQSINPYTGFSSSGDFYVMTGDTNMIHYGSYHYENINVDEIQRTVPFFKQKGPGEKYLGAARGNIFSLDTTGNSTRIGECKYLKITTSEGESRTVYGSRLSGKSSSWQVALGDKIFEVDDKGNLKQAGWVDWRTFTTEEGEKLVVLMTKGINKKSKWAGRFNGKLYIEM